MTRARLVTMIVLGVAALGALTVLVPSDLPSPTSLVGAGGETSTSSTYRERLLQYALKGEGLSAWGGQGRNLASSALGSSSTSIDNEYLLLASDSGLIPLAGFLLIVAALVSAMIRLRRSGGAWALPAVTLANFAGLFFVAMITQQEIYIWALVGACAGLMASRDWIDAEDE
jgi:O-antigen ligase